MINRAQNKKKTKMNSNSIPMSISMSIPILIIKIMVTYIWPAKANVIDIAFVLCDVRYTMYTMCVIHLIIQHALLSVRSLLNSYMQNNQLDSGEFFKMLTKLWLKIRRRESNKQNPYMQIEVPTILHTYTRTHIILISGILI